MGTKNNPGKFDYYDKLLPDEPHFLLSARDPMFASFLFEWSRIRLAAVECGDRPEADKDVVQEAIECAYAGAKWRKENMGAWRKPVVEESKPVVNQNQTFIFDYPNIGTTWVRNTDGSYVIVTNVAERLVAYQEYTMKICFMNIENWHKYFTKSSADLQKHRV